jgi:hypothetical protein
MTENWGAAYLDHYEKYFRQPVEGQTFTSNEQPDGPAIQILTFEEVFKECRVFASLGLTHFADQINGICEVYMPVDAGFSSVPAILAHTLFYLVQEKFSIGYGISIGNLEMTHKAFSAKYNKSAVYFANPYGLPLEFIKVRFGEQYGMILLAILLSRQEHEYFLDRGAIGLGRLLKEKRVDPYNISRPSCV